jgi:hypothetical protein
MRWSRFTEEQIIGVLKEALAGHQQAIYAGVTGSSRQTFLRLEAALRGGSATDRGARHAFRASRAVQRNPFRLGEDSRTATVLADELADRTHIGS